METFLLTCYSNGYVRKRIQAPDFKTAHDQCVKEGFNMYDDYFLETEKEGNKIEKMHKRTIYLDEER